MIHKYKYKDTNIVLDINSGSLHIVDDLCYDVLGLYEAMQGKDIVTALKDRYPISEIEEALLEIAALEEKGRLFSKDGAEAMAGSISSGNPVVKALCLHIAHDCNLSCKYCFAGEGEYSGKRSLMSAAVGKKALDFLVKNSANRRNLEIDFFGGEPTINFPSVKEIVMYGKELEKTHDKSFRFTLTTNALAITEEIIDFCNEHMYNIVLSIDGRKETNDHMRRLKSGGGSYDKILPNIKSFVEKRQGKGYYVRGTFTRHNLDFSEDVLHLKELGFKQISLEPVVAPKEADYSLTEENLPKLFSEYDRLTDIICECKDEEFNFFHFNIDLTGGSCTQKRISGCGAGCEYLSVTPEGDLYPCHQFAGLNDFKIGTVYEGIENIELTKNFRAVNVYKKPECKDCWAKFYCSGGCAANAYQFSGDILGTYKIGCELQKKRIECAIYLQIVRNNMR